MTRMKMRHLPTRLATGSYILGAGVEKLGADDETAKRLHSMAAGAYRVLEDVDPRTFVKALSVAEMTLGTALILPLVPSWLAGLGLGAFSGGLLGLYLETPGLRRQGSLRPTPEGMAVSKDVWMAGISLSLLIDGGRSNRARAKSKKRSD